MTSLDETAHKQVKDKLDRPLAKRFYKLVEVVEDGEGFGIALDGRQLKTPAKAQLFLPNRKLADAVAAEWDAQKNHIHPDTMPLTRIANTAIDRVESGVAPAANEIISFAGSDLLCYRADSPDGLVTKQDENWQPALTWASRELGCHFVCVAGVMHVAQPPETLQAFAAHIQAKNSFVLAALHGLTVISGSAIVAAALEAGGIDLATAWAAAQTDEDWQVSLWGDDEEARIARERRKAEFEASARFLELLKD